MKHLSSSGAYTLRVIAGLDLLPHAPPMRLVEELIELVPGVSARCARLTNTNDWFFQGHFPGRPVVPAVILIELLAQTGGLAAGSTSAPDAAPIELRVAAIGPCKFPDAALPDERLEAAARVVGQMGGLFKIEGQVTANGRLVATGGLTLSRPR